MGRTTEMIRALPASGATIIVPMPSVRQQVLDALLELRGPEVESRCTVLLVERFADVDRIETGQPVVVDHTFYTMAPKSLQREVGFRTGLGRV